MFTRMSTMHLSMPILGLLLYVATLNSCNQPNSASGTPENSAEPITIQADITGLRAYETTWEKGDAIGVFAVREGQILGSSTQYGSVANARYITPQADGQFTVSDKEGISLSEKGAADLIAYYPYTAEVADYSLAINLADQTQPAKIDLMRGTSKTPLKPGANRANLVFSHELAQAVFSIKTDNSALDLSGLKVTLQGLTTSASYDLPTGVFIRGTEKALLTAYTAKTSTKSHAIRTLFLLPGEDLSQARITFELGERKATFTPKAIKTEKGKKYTFHAKVTGAEGSDMTVEATVDDTEIPGSDPIPLYPSTDPDPGIPTPPADPTRRAAYAEIPVPTRDHGDVQLVMHMAPDSWFGGNYRTPGGNGQRRNYTIYFAKEKYQPLFVAYPLYRDCMEPKVDRTDAWDFDPDVAKKWQADLTTGSYKGGYSRGHMMASSDRYGTRELNRTTFYCTNMVPQNQTQNGGVWNQLEQRAQYWAKSDANIDTLYIACGPILPKSGGATVGDRSNKRVPVPTHTWKVILTKDKKDGKWHSMAVKMPNNESVKGSKWYNYMVSVKSLEEELGFTFFTHLDPSIADQVKSQVDHNYWK